MKKWLHSAAVSRGLLTALVVLALVAGGYWGYQWWSGSSEQSALEKQFANDPFELWCPDCQKQFPYTRAEARKLPKQADKVQCPECKKFVASWGPPPTQGLGAP